ncbi:glycoside hydrolase family 73 protein [Acinetobacter modestus]|uniref:glycoside hydrolase family 73 protein n=1 Tax=Acinetobacter modestus TaxID=1776740 RepID=UPI00301B3139
MSSRNNNDDEKEKTILQYDALGFISYQKQALNPLVNEMDSVKKILESCLDEIKYRNSQPKLSAFEQAILDANKPSIDLDDLIHSSKQSTTALNRAAKSIEDLIVESNKTDEIKSQSITKLKRRAIEINSTEDVIREFGSKKTEDTSQQSLSTGQTKQPFRKIAETLVNTIRNTAVNAHGTDPTVDAMNEVATALTPVKRAAGFMLRPLTGWMKSRKRNEPLPKEQSDHNRKLIKVLEKIAANNNGGGLFGLLKMLPMALAGIGSTVATAVTGLGPVLATALAGAVGAYLGTKIHDQLDETETGQSVNDFIGNATARTLALLGNDAAKEAIETNDRLADAERYKYRKENPAWYSNDGVYRFARMLGIEGFMKESKPGSMLYQQRYGGQGVNGKGTTPFGAVGIPVVNSHQIAPIKDGAKGEKQISFIQKNWGMAVKIADALNTRPELILSQFAKETDWGNSVIDGTNNLGNIKANKGWTGKTIKAYDKIEKSHDAYKVYKSPEDFADDYIKLIGKTDRYKGVIGSQTAEDFYSNLKKSGYATDKNYVQDGIETAKSVMMRLDMNKAKIIPPTPKIEKTDSSQNLINTNTNTIMQRAKTNVPVLNMQSSVKPTAARSNNLAVNYSQPKIDTNIQPAKEFLTSPAPQEVVVKNQNSGTINQNVSNRLLAHAITGGLGMGDKWNG